MKFILIAFLTLMPQSNILIKEREERGWQPISLYSKVIGGEFSGGWGFSAIACFWWSRFILARCATVPSNNSYRFLFNSNNKRKRHRNKKNKNEQFFLKVSKKNIAVFVFLYFAYLNLKSNEMYFYFILSVSFIKPQDEGKKGKFIGRNVL